MAGFFSLGGGRGSGNNQNRRDRELTNPLYEINSENLFWYKNREDVPSSKSFELWQNQNLYLSGAGPSRSSLNNSDEFPARSTSIMTMSTGVGTTSCQDCGNQAKKGCDHMRCRTCCNSQGFNCHTHVRSTWIPASKRREQRAQLSVDVQNHGRRGTTKRLREHPSSSSSLAYTRIPAKSSEDGAFPAEVNSSAVFRCVRVSSVEEPDNQYAYRTAVNIGGRIFKGILYNQGQDIANYIPDESSTGAGSGLQPLNFIPAGATTVASATDTSGVAGALYDPTPPLTSFISGTQFFFPPRSQKKKIAIANVDLDHSFCKLHR